MRDRLLCCRAVGNDFAVLVEAGTVGSMPGAAALSYLRELYDDGVPVFLLHIDRQPAVLVALAESADGWWSTVTYVRPGFHSVELSRLLKDTAWEACRLMDRKYRVLVSPDNAPAVASMSAVWPPNVVDVEHLADGTLAYVPVRSRLRAGQKMGPVYGALGAEFMTVLVPKVGSF